MVSANEAGLYLRETSPLSHNILFTSGVVPRSDVGQRTNLNVSCLLKGYCNMQIETGDPVYPASVRDSAKSGLGSAANRYLNYPRESDYVNRGGFHQGGKVSSPPMLDESVGGVVVVGARESRVQGEGRQEANIFLVESNNKSCELFRTFRKVKLVKSNEDDKLRSNPEDGKLASGEPDALKGARPVRRRLRHEVAYVFVVLE